MIANRPDKSKLYYPHMPTAWWFRKWNYFLFLLRELSSVFIAIFLVVYLLQIYTMTQGADAYADFAGQFRAGGWIAFHGVALIFAVYHSLTWFKTAAVILTPRLGGWVMPPWMVVALHIAAWLAVSAIILILYVMI
ncbi:MAG: fumarate reductase subunit C [bacterium]